MASRVRLEEPSCRSEGAKDTTRPRRHRPRFVLSSTRDDKMPVTYEIHLRERLLRTRCVGEVTFAEVVAHFEELRSR